MTEPQPTQADCEAAAALSKAQREVDPTIERLQAVMLEYKIPERRGIAFLGEIAWVLGVEIDFRLVPIEKAQLERTDDDRPAR